MKIVGSGNKVLDKDLLTKLAVSQKSSNTISKAEAQNAVSAARTALKDEFAGATSSSGMARAEKAITNTLKLAIESGWVKSGASKEVITAFLEGTGKGSLSATVADIKADIKAGAKPATRYGGRTSTVTYSGGGRRTTPARTTPAPARTTPARSTPRPRPVGT
jgi:hypothetical protein